MADKASMNDIGISPQDTIWMGNSYLVTKEGDYTSYWGYTHGAKSRKQDVGFRLVLEKLEHKGSP